MGADGIGTTCGFFHSFKTTSQKLPVFRSQVPHSCRFLGWGALPPDKQVGVITISKSVTPAIWKLWASLSTRPSSARKVARPSRRLYWTTALHGLSDGPGRLG